MFNRMTVAFPSKLFHRFLSKKKNIMSTKKKMPFLLGNLKIYYENIPTISENRKILTSQNMTEFIVMERCCAERLTTKFCIAATNSNVGVYIKCIFLYRVVHIFFIENS
jgi:hypothetical protein